eukprot:6212576-Pleurochrysis_carterae.AAC.3
MRVSHLARRRMTSPYESGVAAFEDALDPRALLASLSITKVVGLKRILKAVRVVRSIVFVREVVHP